MAMAKDKDALNAEIAGNYRAFQDKFPGLLAENEGKFCLMRHREIVRIFDSANEAYLAAAETYLDGIFSIQEVSDNPIDLGIFSHAFPGG